MTFYQNDEICHYCQMVENLVEETLGYKILQLVSKQRVFFFLFLGLAVWFWQFIENYAIKMAVLYIKS